MKNFMYFSASVAFLSAAIFCGTATYFLVFHVPQYEKTWNAGFAGFDRVVSSIHEVAITTKPLLTVLPTSIEEMKKMNTSIATMNDAMITMNSSVAHMDYSIEYMARVIPPRMDNMTWHMRGMKKQLSPSGMMRSMMP